MDTNHQNHGSALGITFKHPTSQLGMDAHRLIAECPPLDPNSVYCNLLQCTHFANTCMGAFQGDQLVGFVSAYVIPDRPDTLFVWQVAIGKTIRGQGIAKELILHLLKQPSCQAIKHIETTITEPNTASWALFKSLTSALNTSLTSSLFYDRQQHFDNQHDSEMLVHIGPFSIHK